ncbi:MAG: hypothetical protein US99_C0083G0001, partial [Candidatus Daviesbacteria bacterium GW2011_GWF2_38_6]
CNIVKNSTGRPDADVASIINHHSGGVTKQTSKYLETACVVTKTIETICQTIFVYWY